MSPIGPLRSLSQKSIINDLPWLITSSTPRVIIDIDRVREIGSLGSLQVTMSKSIINTTYNDVHLLYTDNLSSIINETYN
jgi:hypothetical protein